MDAGARPTSAPNFRETKRLVQQLDLHTVCEEAGCPNIYECWADHTATFMILGDRCTRACGFCLVDTRKPLPLDPDEPRRVADAVATPRLEHAVITSVARDDLADGGAAGVRGHDRGGPGRRTPATQVEVLIPDCKGDPTALDVIFAARPDVLNHNLETVARLHRAARPSAAYARSLALLGRAADAGLLTKSGIILGMGETRRRGARRAVADLRRRRRRAHARAVPAAVAPAPAGRRGGGRPTSSPSSASTPRPSGSRHVEAGPLVRSSYHAGPREAASVGWSLSHAVPSAGGDPVGRLDAAAITPELGEFLEAQPMFFVATAPTSATSTSTSRRRATTRSGCSIATQCRVSWT